MSDILRWEERKTRKPHRCWGCGKAYPIGTEMINAAYVDGRTVTDCYWCDTCQEYMHRYFEYGDEASFGDIFDNDPDGWKNLFKELHKEKLSIITA